MSKPKRSKRQQTPAPSTLDAIREDAKRFAARRLGNPAADVEPTAADFIAAARATGNALVLDAARQELGQ